MNDNSPLWFVKKATKIVKITNSTVNKPYYAV